MKIKIENLIFFKVENLKKKSTVKISKSHKKIWPTRQNKDKKNKNFFFRFIFKTCLT